MFVHQLLRQSGQRYIMILGIDKSAKWVLCTSKNDCESLADLFRGCYTHNQWTTSSRSSVSKDRASFLGFFWQWLLPVWNVSILNNLNNFYPKCAVSATNPRIKFFDGLLIFGEKKLRESVIFTKRFLLVSAKHKDIYNLVFSFHVLCDGLYFSPWQMPHCV